LITNGSFESPTETTAGFHFETLRCHLLSSLRLVDVSNPNRDHEER
jgi:hypothetical protein